MTLSARLYIRTSSSVPSKNSLAQDARCRRFAAPRRCRQRSADRLGPHLRAVHVEPHRVAPAVTRRASRRPAGPGSRTCRDVGPPGVDLGRPPTRQVERIGEAVRRLLHEQRLPRPRQQVGLHPRLERHRSGQVEARGVGDGDPVVHAVEAERLPVPPGRRPRRAGRPCPALPRPEESATACRHPPRSRRRRRARPRRSGSARSPPPRAEVACCRPCRAPPPSAGAPWSRCACPRRARRRARVRGAEVLPVEPNCTSWTPTSSAASRRTVTDPTRWPRPKAL